MAQQKNTSYLKWNEACDWVRDQVIVSFRHRAIISRLSQSSSDIAIQEPSGMLRIELPIRKELTEHRQPKIHGPTGSVAQLMQHVVARLKHIEEMQGIEEQVRIQKIHRRRLRVRRIGALSPSSKKRSSTPSSSRTRSRSNSAS